MYRLILALILFSSFIISACLSDSSDSDDKVITVAFEDKEIEIDENQAEGVELIVVSPPEEMSDVKFSIKDQDPNNAFKIDETSGKITVNDSALLNYEKYEKIVVTVQAKNDDKTVSATYTIKINDLDDGEEKDTTKQDTTDVDTTKQDTTDVDTTKQDTTGVDTTKGDTTGVDTTNGDTTSVDTTKGDTTNVDTTKTDPPPPYAASSNQNYGLPYGPDGRKIVDLGDGGRTVWINMNYYDSTSEYELEITGIDRGIKYKYKIDTMRMVNEEYSLRVEQDSSKDVKVDYYTAELVEVKSGKREKVMDAPPPKDNGAMKRSSFYSEPKEQLFYNSLGSDFFAIVQLETDQWQQTDTIFTNMDFRMRPIPSIKGEYGKSAQHLMFYDKDKKLLDSLRVSGSNGSTNSGTYSYKFRGKDGAAKMSLSDGSYLARLKGKDSLQNDLFSQWITVEFIIDTGSAPVAENPKIEGTLAVGEILTATYDYSDVDGDDEGESHIIWRSGGSNVIVEDSTGRKYNYTGKNFTVRNEDAGKEIQFVVTPKAATGRPADGRQVQSPAVFIPAN